MFSTLGKIVSIAKWLLLLAYVVALFALGVKLYPILKDCWTCEVFGSMYDVFGRVSMQTFPHFQQYILIIVSFCLALWLVYKTYEALTPTIDSMLYPDAPKFSPDYLKTIYKKIFLTMAVFGLFIFNDPRNIFANTFEITLDFGSGISREFLRKKIVKPEHIPDECKSQPASLVYKDDSALSENTKNNMICLMKEVNVLRHDYMDLGSTMFEYGLKPMIVTAVSYILTRVAFFAGGEIIKKFGGRFFIKKILNPKANKLLEKIALSDDENVKKKLKKEFDKVMKQAEGEVNAGKITKGAKRIGNKVNSAGKGVAAVETLAIFALDEDVRIGVAGILLIMGLTIINLYFSFIIVEFMLFLGITIILFPILAACYIFHDVSGLGNFVTVGISSTFSFALRLIFTCLAMVFCAEINDWILGGMFSSSTANITTAQEAIALLKAGDIEAFNEAVGTTWYISYILLALFFNFVLIESSKKFAGWFGGQVKDSSLVQPLVSMGKSSLTTVTSAVRELKNYRKTGTTKASEKGEKIDGFINYFRGKFNGSNDKEG